jgi:hypothetical protein
MTLEEQDSDDKMSLPKGALAYYHRYHNQP